MDGQIFRIARKICLFFFAGDIFVHALVGASAVDGVIKGTLSMIIMLAITVILYRADRKNKIRKSRKKKQDGN